MKIRGSSRLRRMIRRLRHKIAPGALILLYHRVADVESDPWSLCVTPQHFAEHLEVLQTYTHPMRLQQLTQDLQEGKRLHPSVAITFDDGYADNFHNAKPLLEQYDIPATVFITTGCVGHQREFWWDELERLLLQPRTLPETLHLIVNGSTYRWQLGETVHYSQDTYQHHLCSDVEQENGASPRHLYYSLHKLLRPLLEGERRQVLDELLIWAGAEPVGRPTHRSLSLAEVFALGQGKLLEVGSHTVTHPLLSTLSTDSQRHEIQQSKAQLEEVIGHPVSSFAYPYGDYTAKTVGVVRESGFDCACSTVTDVVWQRTDRFQLPRVEVQDWGGEEFAKQLSSWFHC